jgi:hypothetical protein
VVISHSSSSRRRVHNFRPSMDHYTVRRMESKDSVVEQTPEQTGIGLISISDTGYITTTTTFLISASLPCVRSSKLPNATNACM